MAAKPSVGNSETAWKSEAFASSVTDVHGFMDGSCCPHVDVADGKGRLGKNWPRAALPEFVKVSLKS